MKQFLLAIILTLLVGCLPKVTTKLTKTYPSLDTNAIVILFGVDDETPPAAIEIGTVKVGDSGFSINCGWDVVIEKAKMEARKAGGNVLKIIKHIPPSLTGSSCDRITAKIFKIENPEEINKISESKIAKVDSTWNYSKLFVYRSSGLYGALISYNLHLDDSVIFSVKNDSKREIKITKKGMHLLWAKTEEKSEVLINIEFGKEYYFRCSMVMGVLVARPQLQLVDIMQGKSQWNSIKDN